MRTVRRTWLSNTSSLPGIDFYPELATIVGSAVPDYRGRFLRHVGGNSAALGVAQEDATRRVWGITYVSVGKYGEMMSKGWQGVFSYNEHSATCAGIVQNAITGIDGYAGIYFDNAKQVPIANEIRPANMAVRYLILARE